MRRASDFYRHQAGHRGGYHFRYAEDLSFGRGEQAQGPTQAEFQREGTPRVGMAFLEAWHATGDRYYLGAAADAARAGVAGQLCSGGWDYIVEFDPAKRARYRYRADGCGEGARGAVPTTLDDNVSQAMARLLLRVDRELDFKDREIHDASLFALESLAKAQYPNGAWPQRYFEFPDPAEYPVKEASYPAGWPREWPNLDYRGYYTLNDNTHADLVDLFLEAARVYAEPRYLAAAKRGGDFLLLSQMPDPQPAWAQQYDFDMHPAWARQFEPPSVTGGESRSAMRILLVLYRETGDKKYLEPIPKALAYLRASALPPDPNPPARKRQSCAEGAPCLARFYELKTNRGLFISKGTMIRAQALGSARPDGYEVTYDDSDPIRHYSMWQSGAWLDGFEREYERIRAAEPATLRRPQRLSGLSPWESGEPPRRPADAQLARIVASLDERGSWVEDGVAGRADLVASVFAAQPMVVRLGGRTIPLPENETIEIFRGAAPVVERMIVSTTFARNLEALAAAVAGGPTTGREADDR